MPRGEDAQRKANTGQSGGIPKRAGATGWCSGGRTDGKMIHLDKRWTRLPRRLWLVATGQTPVERLSRRGSRIYPQGSQGPQVTFDTEWTPKRRLARLNNLAIHA